MRPLLPALLALASACPAAARDALNIGMPEFPSSLHPHIDPLLVKSYVLGFTTRTVTTYNGEGKLICLLCTEVPSLENGLARREDRPDGTQGLAVTIKLKPDLQWGDGEPVTARDLLFTWKVGSDPNAGFSNGYPWTRADKVDVVDDHTAVLHLPRPLTSFALWDQIIPEHIEGPVYAAAKNPGDYINNTTFNRSPTNPGLWDGPYIISEYRSGSEIVLAPNPHWPGTKPGFNHVLLRFIGDTAALQANILSGDVDTAYTLPLDQILAMRKASPDRFQFLFSPSLTYFHIDVAHDNKVLSDVRVRRALLMAMDRDAISQRLFDGMYKVAPAFVSPRNPEFDASLPPVPFDPDAGARLLTEAGWTPGPDGTRVNAAGQKLQFELLYGAGFRVNDIEAAVLQSGWKKLGADVTLRTEPSRTLFGQTTKHRAFPGMVMYSWTSNIAESPRLTLGSDSIPSEANNWGGANFMGWSNAKFDADVAAAEVELDPAKRKALWADMQRLYLQDLPALPMFITTIGYVLPKWLHGYGPSGTGQAWTQNAEEWRAD